MTQPDQSSSIDRGATNASVNVLDLEPGDKIALRDGAVAEVVANPKDGMWVLVRHITMPQDPSKEGTEDLAFAEDIEGRL